MIQIQNKNFQSLRTCLSGVLSGVLSGDLSGDLSGEA